VGDPLERLCTLRGWDLAVAQRLGLHDAPDGRRVRWPAIGIGGEVVWTCDRSLDGEEPKWLNASGLPVVPPGIHQAMAASPRPVVLLEGLSDWVAMSHAWDVAVGIPGAMTFRHEWAQVLRGRVVICVVDRDQAGDHMAARVLELMPGTLIVRPPEPYQDVDDWRSGVGGEDFAAAVATMVETAPTWTSDRIPPRAVASTNGSAVPPAAPPPDETPEGSSDNPWEAGHIPRLAGDAYIGPVGEYSLEASEVSEACPEAILLTCLVGAGALMGPDTHVQIGSLRPHPGQLYALLVGPAESGAKGTSAEIVVPTFRRASQCWAEDRIAHGFESGQAMFDFFVEWDPSEKEWVQLDERAWVIEEEFAGLLAAAQRAEANITAKMRSSFDSGRMEHRTRKDGQRSCFARMSVLGHITPADLAELGDQQLRNGFANRFLIAWVHRHQVVHDPDPIPGHITNQWVAALAAAERSSLERRFPLLRDATAREVYAHHVKQISVPLGGLVGEVTRRRRAIFARLTAVYAGLECSDEVQPHHMAAARAVVDYSVASTSWLFGPASPMDLHRQLGSVKRAEHAALGRLVSALRTPPPKLAAIMEQRDRPYLTRNEVHQYVYGGHRSEAEITETIEAGRKSRLLVAAGRGVKGDPIRVYLGESFDPAWEPETYRQ